MSQRNEILLAFVYEVKNLVEKIIALETILERRSVIIKLRYDSEKVFNQFRFEGGEVRHATLLYGRASCHILSDRRNIHHLV